MKHVAGKYKAFAKIDLPNRTWPDKSIDAPPRWCSVDLRDGNQALIEPMGAQKKLRLFKMLVNIGFKEIEVGFPSASQTEFDFTRKLIEEKLIPDDVFIQVLTQSRAHLIDRTFEAIGGAKNVILHFYNSTNPLQREIVFNEGRQGIKKIATEAAKQIRALGEAQTQTNIIYQYSPESFSDTEIDFSIEICAAVMDEIKPTINRKMILNLPATVEMSTPNLHADQIEYFCRNLPNRDCAIISLHPHNDRGSAIAATELGLMAGAERVEGTLFGNGERTGNVDLVTLALNLHTQGVNPKLDFSDINDVRQTAEYCTQLPIHPRHPYVGELVFTAFSGSHQDAIKKGVSAMRASNATAWRIPYLPIDPEDVGRNYEAVIRINSQSGKGGIAYIMEHDFGLILPRLLQIEFSRAIQESADAHGKELTGEEIWSAFDRVYLQAENPIRFINHQSFSENGKQDGEMRILKSQLEIDGKNTLFEGKGNGPIDAYLKSLNQHYQTNYRINNYHQHATGSGSDATSATYIELERDDGNRFFGVGMHPNIVSASLKAVTSAFNRTLNAD